MRPSFLHGLAHDRLEGRKVLQLKEYTYNGLVICAVCGKVMVNHSSKNKKGQIYSYYRCRDCKALVSEQAINKTCEEDLTKRLQDHQYMEKDNTVKVVEEKT